MPDPVRMLRTLQLARDHTLSTPGRSGRLVRLPDAVDVLIAGDLHGHLTHFQKLFQMADLAKNPHRHLVLQEMIHGPFHYATGSDRSHQLVDLYAALKCQFPRQVHYLMGNHELAQWTDRKIAKGERDQNALFQQGVYDQYGEHGEAIYTAYKALFAVIPLMIITPNRVCMSHSLPSATKVALYDRAMVEADAADVKDFAVGSPIYSQLWGRDASLNVAEQFLQKVDADWLITGHIPTEEGFAVPNPKQLILDCAEDPAACCLFRADQAITHEELLAGVRKL